MKALGKDISRAVMKNGYDMSDGKLIIPAAKFAIGGVFSSEVLRHKSVQAALDEGDPEKADAMRLRAVRMGFAHTLEGYEPQQVSSDANIIPDAGINFILNLLCGSASKVMTWYQGLIAQNTTPNSSWGAGWSGTLTHMANEFPDSSASAGEGNFYTGSGRKSTVFGVATNRSILTSTASSFTMGTGTADATIYGSTLNSNSTVNWDGTSGYLLSAALFSSPKSGLGAADILNVSYELRGTSA